VSGSRKVRIVKRDGSSEPYDGAKLAGTVYRAMWRGPGGRQCACHLAVAIGIHLRRSHLRRISSAAIFEMVVLALRRVGFTEPADRMEAHHRRRARLRGGLRVHHDSGQVSLWDKSWLGELGRRSWFLSRPTARILAGQVECELLEADVSDLSRQDVLERLNRLVSEYGLADAVPVAR